jgi:uncharacterized Zn finger protein
MFYGGFRPYVSVAERRKQAARYAAKLAKKGQVVRPIRLEGPRRAIASSFWGRAWCDNLESYSDYENRLPRGRTYVRNGSVVDLQIGAGRVAAIVSGSEIYQVAIEIDPLDKKIWKALVRECTGRIGSMIELLKGRFSDDVMQILARPKTGLFPSPRAIRLSCSCPDWAEMCKHVAAALYGVGARLDEEPEIFFTLRQVDQKELVSAASTARRLGTARPSGTTKLAAADLASVFGIELDETRMPAAAERVTRKGAPRRERPPRR